MRRRDDTHRLHRRPLHVRAWAVLLLAVASITVLVGHDVAYLLSGADVDPYLHEYMGGAAFVSRWVLATCVLLMIRRIFARDGAVDAFLEIAGPRVVVGRMLGAGALATTGLLAVELAERAAGTGSVALPTGLIFGAAVTQFATVALALVLPAWTRTGIQAAIARVRGRTPRPHPIHPDRACDAGVRVALRAPRRIDHAGIAWRCRALPLRGSPTCCTPAR